MQRNLQEILSGHRLYPAPEALEELIISRIRVRARRRARSAFFASASFALVSIAGFIPAVRYLGASAAASGFRDYLSLALSEHGNLVAYWKEFSLTLVESMPVIAISIVLLVLSAFLWSAGRTAKNARAALSMA